MITPCSKCHKRHGRDHDAVSVPVKSSASTRRHARALVLMASLLAGAAASSPSMDRAHVVHGKMDSPLASVMRGGRRNQAVVVDADDHEIGHADDDNYHEDHEENHDEDHEEEHLFDDHMHHDEEETFTTAANDDKTPKPWLPVLGATLLVNLATLSGLVLLVVPAIRKGMLTTSASSESTNNGKVIDIVIPSFAVGALMATAIFLVLPEALHLIEGAHGNEADGHDEGEGHDDDEESIAAAKLGCGMLGGFLLPVFLSILFHRSEQDDGEEEDSAAPADEEECKSCMEKDVAAGASPQDGGDVTTAVIIRPLDDDSASVHNADGDSVSVVGELQEEHPEAPRQRLVIKTKTFINYRLGASILIGDAFHNFADGLFIGAAFLGCSWATAISITAVSLFHELAQELADFIILTRYVGLSVTKACVWNFASGLSVCLGGITVLAAKPSDEAIGIILAFAGGVYVNIAACESVPRVERCLKDRTDRALALFSIIVGTIPIGLILLDHKHC